jgi:hypothetical protein
LNDDERAALTLAANIPAGAWDWQALAQWDAEAIKDWGMDAETLATWNTDAANLATILGVDAELPNPEPQQEPMLESECFIEIHCSKADLQSMQEALNGWATRPTVTINIS